MIGPRGKAMLAFNVGLIAVFVLVSHVSAQNRDMHTGRLVLDDAGGGGTFNTMTIETPADLPGDRTLTIPDPGPAGGEFVLSNAGSIGITEIETPNANETLRLNPSGDLVQVGNPASPSTGSGLDVQGNVVMNGPQLTLSSSVSSTEFEIAGPDVDVTARDLTMNVTETVTINGNLVVNGNASISGTLTLGGRLFANSNFNRIGSSTDSEQLRIRGSIGGSSDHLYVVGNVRVTDELRIGSGSNTTVFQSGTQAGQISYTLPTSIPAAAATGTSMGAGVLETDNSGTMSWRNSGSAGAALNFPSTNDGSTSDLTVTVTGAELGDLVVLGIPNSAQPAGSVWYHGWVSAADTVTIRLHNNSGAAVDPASATFNVMVLRP